MPNCAVLSTKHLLHDLRNGTIVKHICKSTLTKTHLVVKHTFNKWNICGFLERSDCGNARRYRVQARFGIASHRKIWNSFLNFRIVFNFFIGLLWWLIFFFGDSFEGAWDTWLKSCNIIRYLSASKLKQLIANFGTQSRWNIVKLIAKYFV